MICGLRAEPTIGIHRNQTQRKIPAPHSTARPRLLHLRGGGVLEPQGLQGRVRSEGTINISSNALLVVGVLTLGDQWHLR